MGDPSCSRLSAPRDFSHSGQFVSSSLSSSDGKRKGIISSSCGTCSCAFNFCEFEGTACVSRIAGLGPEETIGSTAACCSFCVRVLNQDGGASCACSSSSTVCWFSQPGAAEGLAWANESS